MNIFKEFELSSFNAYKIKSKCSLAYFPESESDLIELFTTLKDTDYIVIGNGNNIILSKSYYNIPFVILNGVFDKITINGNYVEAEAGATTFNLSKFALENSLTGAEFLYDIPSSIGGAVVMNAGTKEGETKNILHKVRYLDLNDLNVKEKSNSQINLSYRNSYFQDKKNAIILKAWFNLSEGNKKHIAELMDESKSRRWSKQPREYPNCGSVFKRPPGRFVGPMLDELGLKGFTIGGAEVSKKHSGFIVNKGNATGEDILTLIKVIQKKVVDKFDVELEVEQRVI